MVEPELTEIARARHKILAYLDERERAAASPADASDIARALGWSQDRTEEIVHVGAQLGFLALDESGRGVVITPHGHAALSRDEDAIGK